ncbi:MAG: hypothetical protein ABSE22_05220 [Xanthobacteraceae bacterium]|jgi:hypothetical protein
MRKLIVTLAAMALMLGMTAMTASAQTQGAHSLNALRNATPIVKEIGCRGPADWGKCPPGRHFICAYGRCWCGPC